MADVDEKERGEVHPCAPFTFWILKKTDDSFRQNYESRMTKLATVRSIEEFWAVQSHLIRPDDLPSTAVAYHLFHEGIAPAWEDPANRDGGKFVLRIRKGRASLPWENLLLAMIGNQFGAIGGEICGLVFTPKATDVQISIWTRSAEAAAKDTYKVRAALRKIVGPAFVDLSYRRHELAR